MNDWVEYKSVHDRNEAVGEEFGKPGTRSVDMKNEDGRYYLRINEVTTLEEWKDDEAKD